jgi:hypothetical protein
MVRNWMRFRKWRTVTVALFAALWTASVSSAYMLNVTLDTSPLIGHAAGPFSINFQLNPTVDPGNNTVTINNFNFGTGNASGTPTYINGASGDLYTAVTLTDSTLFLNYFSQTFVPGNLLSFTISFTPNMTVNEDPGLGGTPDQFTFAILDNLGFPIPTMFPSGALMTIDIVTPNPDVNTYATDPGTPPTAGGPGITMNAPQYTVVGAIPEPTTVTLFLFGGGLMAWSRFRRRA